MLRGIAKIKNVSGSSYDVEEMPGVTIPNNGIIDLLDDTLNSYYVNFDDVERLLTSSITAKLRQDIIAGDIEIIELASPLGINHG